MSDAFAQWFEGVWSDREERVYPATFGALGDGVFTPAPSTYERFGKEPHPGWRNHGVFASPPNERRASWLYVTSGLSNPWNLEQPGRDPSGFSGLGFELVVESTESADWAVPLLHNLMAYELLVAVGSYEGAELLEYGNRVPLHGSITPAFDSAIRWLLVVVPPHYPATFELASGRVDFFHLVGATDAEVELARQSNQEMLVALLQTGGAWPYTDAARASLR
jgi:hypothetical protein